MAKRRKILSVIGTRPNMMKIAPIAAALVRRSDEFEHVLVHTGQHYDPALSDVFFEELGLRRPDHHLGVGSGSHAEQTARVMTTFEPLLEELKPDWVVVVGDVNSTLACALVAAKSAARLAHVEAGLRSRDWTMPEEVNRVATDHVSDLLLAPSPDAMENLAAEGLAERAMLVGNVMIDTLFANLDRARNRRILQQLSLAAKGYALLTLHRPSNVDDAEVFTGLIRALGQIATKLPIIWPAHPRVRDRLLLSELPEGLRVIEPVGYLDSIALQEAARFVMTDSGGVQEETSALGIPCLTLRTTTERPVTIKQGTNELVGVEPERIVVAAGRVLVDRQRSSPAYGIWDGCAARRIADVLLL